jgi:twinkle protein
MPLNPQEFSRRHLQPYKTHGSEIIPTYCPFCHGGDKRDKYTFALNTEKQTYNCKRGTCGQQGHFTQLCKEFGEEADKDERYEPMRPIKKPFIKPVTPIQTPKKKVEDYLKLRGFSKETWERRGVGESNGNIAIPYYENSEIVLMKFRKPEKYNGNGQKAWREAGGKAVLWGMDLCEKDTDLIICEGEMDALALDECGAKNVLSVPSGAEDLTWIENCWEWLEQFENIVFWGDNDGPGKEMVRKCALRLSNWKCYVVNSIHKDANISLVKDGKEKTLEAVVNAKLVPKLGLLNLADVVPIDIKNIARVSSGISTIDRTVGGFLMGELSVWTGKSGQGKSTLLGQVLINSVNDGVPVCAYSGELRADRFQYWINLQAAGKFNIETYFDSLNEKEVAYLTPEINNKIRKWYDGKFWLYDNNIADNNEETSILKLFEYAAKRYDCKVFLVDNLMTSRFACKSENDYYRAQSNFVGELVHFAKAFEVHVHLVAHPHKTKGKLEKENISGTGDITNRADNVFSVSRSEEEGSRTNSTVTVLKNRSNGVQDIEIGLMFDSLSKRFYNVNGSERKVYGWELMPNEPIKPVSFEDFGQEVVNEF